MEDVQCVGTVAGFDGAVLGVGGGDSCSAKSPGTWTGMVVTREGLRRPTRCSARTDGLVPPEITSSPAATDDFPSVKSRE